MWLIITAVTLFLLAIILHFHPSKVASKWDVIVIGSGLSGLTTAKILAASSRKVLVLEQHDRAGGACHTFDLDRFEFDVGLHYVAEMYPGSELYKICSAMTDSQVQWQRIEDPFDLIVVGDKRYGRMNGGQKVFRQQLKEWFPEEKNKIDAYFDFINSCLKEIPWMFRIKFIPTFITRFLLKSGIFHLLTKICKYSDRTLLDTMREFAFSKELQAVCSYYYVNYGIPPNRASFFQHWLFLLDGGYYPIGGATMITSNIVRSIEKFGGKVLVKADVKEITFEDGKVKGLVVNYGTAGCFIESPMIVSTIPLIHLFSDLIPQQISTNLTMFDVVKQLNAVDSPKVATFQAYIGLSGSQNDLKLPPNNCFWFKNNDIFEIDKYLRMSLEEALDYGCPPFVYVTFPSAKDPAWDDRHPGVSTCQLISVTNPEWFEDFKDKTKRKSQKRINKEEYFNLKNTIGEMMIEQLIKMFPDVAKEIVFTEFSSSLSQQYYMQNAYGELYSLAHNVDRFKPHFWSELRCTSEIPGLYLSGQDVLFCGVSSAFHNGLLTAGVILNRDLYKDLREAYNLQSAEENKSK
uniref:All-trans-retinol 13,14-reductase n=1 Tax=Ascaris lumbricoides TaxID=6252 RepID=A0A0M3I171_ASCLU